MTREYLDFEEPIAQLERRILELETAVDISPEEISKQIDTLSKSIIDTTQKIYKKLTPWQCVQVASHPSRPHFFDYINKVFNEFDELHGDRNFGDDRALIGGLAKIDNYSVMVIGCLLYTSPSPRDRG